MVTFYRLLLRLYPRAMQEEYGREMTLSFRDRWNHEGSPALLLATILDTIGSAAGAHLEILGQDLRIGLRGLRKDKSFAMASIATLALGIGATTAMFSLLHAVLLRPLPFQQPHRVVRVFDTNRTLRIDQFASSEPNFDDWSRRVRLFTSLTGFRFLDLNVTEQNGAERVQGMAVLGPFWETVGQQPLLGRTFRPEEHRTGHDSVVVIGEGFWERRFARDPGVLGQSISIGGTPRTIVGVARSDLGMGTAIDVFGPLVPDLQSGRNNRQINVVGRLKAGVTIEQASQELNQIAEQLDREYPKANQDWRVQLIPVRDWVVEPAFQRGVYLLLGAVGLLLAIACVNVANLLIARAAAREREFAARLALGASKSRLLRQLTTESLMLGLVGGAAGLCVAWVLIRALTPLLPNYVPRVEISLEVLGFSLLVTLTVSLIFGLGPALAGTRGDIRHVLQASTRGAAAVSGWRAMPRQILVASQVALATVLLVGALLVSLSFSRVLHQDFGFRTDHLIAARFSPSSSKTQDPRKWGQYVDAILAEMRALPGVTSAAITSEIPFGAVDTQQSVIAEERAEAIRSDGVQSSWRMVTSDYLTTLGIRLLKGRAWSRNENFRIRPILISEDLSRRLWPEGGDPVGRQIRMSNTLTFTIIGVVSDVRHRTMTDRQPTATVYWPAAFLSFDTMTIVLRTQGDPAAMAGSMREAMRRVDPMQPLFEITTMEDFVSRVASAPRLAALLLTLFAGLALLLAAVGVAGLAAYAVARRRPELAIRMALGATGQRVIREVTSTQFRLCVFGVIAGLAVAWALRPVVAKLLFGIEAGHPPVYAGAALTLLAAGLLACLLPALRIARIDPASALRSE